MSSRCHQGVCVLLFSQYPKRVEGSWKRLCVCGIRLPCIQAKTPHKSIRGWMILRFKRLINDISLVIQRPADVWGIFQVTFCWECKKLLHSKMSENRELNWYWLWMIVADSDFPPFLPAIKTVFPGLLKFRFCVGSQKLPELLKFGCHSVWPQVLLDLRCFNWGGGLRNLQQKCYKQNVIQNALFFILFIFPIDLGG